MACLTGAKSWTGHGVSCRPICLPFTVQVPCPNAGHPSLEGQTPTEPQSFQGEPSGGGHCGERLLLCVPNSGAVSPRSCEYERARCNTSKRSHHRHGARSLQIGRGTGSMSLRRTRQCRYVFRPYETPTCLAAYNVSRAGAFTDWIRASGIVSLRPPLLTSFGVPTPPPVSLQIPRVPWHIRRIARQTT